MIPDLYLNSSVSQIAENLVGEGGLFIADSAEVLHIPAC